MKIYKTASGQKRAKMEFSDWEKIGNATGWLKQAQVMEDQRKSILKEVIAWLKTVMETERIKSKVKYFHVSELASNMLGHADLNPAELRQAILNEVTNWVRERMNGGELYGAAGKANIPSFHMQGLATKIKEMIKPTGISEEESAKNKKYKMKNQKVQEPVVEEIESDDNFEMDNDQDTSNTWLSK